MRLRVCGEAIEIATNIRLFVCVERRKQPNEILRNFMLEDMSKRHRAVQMLIQIAQD
jgi:hypothetical protein